VPLPTDLVASILKTLTIAAWPPEDLPGVERAATLGFRLPTTGGRLHAWGAGGYTLGPFALSTPVGLRRATVRVGCLDQALSEVHLVDPQVESAFERCHRRFFTRLPWSSSALSIVCSS